MQTRRVTHSPDYYQQRESNEREIRNGSVSSGYQRRSSTDYAEMCYDEPSPPHIQNHRNVIPNNVHSQSQQRLNVSQQALGLRNKPRTKV